MPKRTDSEIPRHPIGVVAERTGLSNHVLRAWERRYGVVHPSRAPGGRRLYSDADVERLVLLSSATHAGRSVASVAELPSDELRKLVQEDAERAGRQPRAATPHRARAMTAVRQLAPERLEPILRRGLLSLGTVPFLEEVVAPLLVDIGDEWHAGRVSVAQEHAASAAMERLIGRLIEELEVPDDAPRVVIATPRGERHALGAMLAAAAAAHDGWHVTWLGADLPSDQIVATATAGDARVVALSVVGDPDSETHGDLRAVRHALPTHVSLVVGGAGARSLTPIDGLSTVRDLAQWRSLLRRYRSTSPR